MVGVRASYIMWPYLVSGSPAGSVYEQVVRRADAVEAKATRTIEARATGGLAAGDVAHPTEPPLAGALMQGYMLKRGGLFGGWRPRFCALFNDRLEWRLEQRVRPIVFYLLSTASKQSSVQSC